MKPIRLEYEGCTVEAEIVQGHPLPDINLKIFDPKGQRIFEQQYEMGGFSTLDYRLIKMLQEPCRTEVRKIIRNQNAWRCRVIAEARRSA